MAQDIAMTMIKQKHEKPRLTHRKHIGLITITETSILTFSNSVPTLAVMNTKFNFLIRDSFLFILMNK